MFTLYNEHPGRVASHDPDGSHFEYIAIVLFIVSKYAFQDNSSIFAALLFLWHFMFFLPDMQIFLVYWFLPSSAFLLSWSCGILRKA